MGINQVYIVRPEAQVDTDTELGIEIGIELSLGIPAIETWGTRDIHTWSRTHVAQCNIETSQGTHIAIEQAKVYVYISPCRCTQHDTAIHLGLEVLESSSTSPIGLADIIALHARTLG